MCIRDRVNVLQGIVFFVNTVPRWRGLGCSEAESKFTARAVCVVADSLTLPCLHADEQIGPGTRSDTGHSTFAAACCGRRATGRDSAPLDRHAARPAGTAGEPDPGLACTVEPRAPRIRTTPTRRRRAAPAGSSRYRVSRSGGVASRASRYALPRTRGSLRTTPATRSRRPIPRRRSPP